MKLVRPPWFESARQAKSVKDTEIIPAVLRLFKTLEELPDEPGKLEPEVAERVGAAHRCAAQEIVKSTGLSYETVSQALMGATMPQEDISQNVGAARKVVDLTLHIAFQIEQAISRDLPN